MKITINGTTYNSCELVKDGGYCGIRTPKTTFWLSPVCDENGREIKTLPPYLPSTIKAVTDEPPDLTQRYPKTVKKLFAKQRAYFARISLKQYLEEYPDTLCDKKTFTKERKRILSASLEDFAHYRSTRHEVWCIHGTMQLADQHGYLGDVYEDGPEGSRTCHASITMALTSALMRERRIDYHAAAMIVGRLKHVMIYQGETEQRFIYLEGVKEEAMVTCKLSATKKVIPWHSEGFTTIYRHTTKGDVAEERPLTNEFRALCQLLNEQPAQTARFSKIEPLIGTRTRDLDVDEGRGTMASPPGKRRVRDLLATQTGRVLRKWGVLKTVTSGRQKFIKLSPPNPAK